ncbi:ATP-dependent nuclease [Micromonospora robiginosa]|uniref:AAA family ATPase n=1 Tax=Micromonospora robiginosa TaxID=2749844 RepID=A0A7L6B9I6_9ACTN|nr:AAA family ATPase [Micromonospora ferruginea]QLQ38230.1 AAA family ATPase [Micromonospora ferruginea]
MLFTSVSVRDFRSIASSGRIPLGPITLLVGQNNAGKSALVRAIHLAQDGAPTSSRDVRIGSRASEVKLELGPWHTFTEEGSKTRKRQRIPVGATLTLLSHGTVHGGMVRINDAAFTVKLAPNTEPNNAIYPVLATRRQQNYEEQVRREAAITVAPTDSNLVSRVMALATSEIPEARTFRQACKDVLGVSLNVFTTEHGQQSVGIQIDRFADIPLSAMGAGITSALNLLISLSTSHNKLFLIEEPENDLHPQALKALLDLILKASNENQFVITTHSSVVLAKLGSAPGAVVVHTKSDGLIPPSTSFDVIDSPPGRISVMQDLGYELADLELGEGWLIFEESSAERLAREFLIPWFAPRLVRLRTLAASGTSRLQPIVQDFFELFLFAHLEPMYRGRAWVIADGDESGVRVIRELRAKFPTWQSDRFINLEQHDFEKYYPEPFMTEAERILSMADKRQRRESKRILLHKVLTWVGEDEDRAKRAFSESAREVVEKLQEIERRIVELGRIPFQPVPASGDEPGARYSLPHPITTPSPRSAPAEKPSEMPDRLPGRDDHRLGLQLAEDGAPLPAGIDGDGMADQRYES